MKEIFKEMGSLLSAMNTDPDTRLQTNEPIAKAKLKLLKVTDSFLFRRLCRLVSCIKPHILSVRHCLLSSLFTATILSSIFEGIQ